MSGEKSFLRYASVILIVFLMICISAVSSQTFRFGSDTSGQLWFGGDNDVITNSNGKAWVASVANLKLACYDLNDTGGTVFVPSTTISGSTGYPIILSSNITVQGAGTSDYDHNSGSVIENTGSEHTFVLQGNNDGTLVDNNIKLVGLTIKGDAANGDGINATFVKQLIVEDCVIFQNGGDGIDLNACYMTHISECDIRHNTHAGVNISSASHAHISNCYFGNNNAYGSVNMYSGYAYVDQCYFENIAYVGNNAPHINASGLSSGGEVRVSDSRLYSVDDNLSIPAIYVDDGNTLSVINSYFYINKNAIDCDQGLLHIHGNHFRRSSSITLNLGHADNSVITDNTIFIETDSENAMEGISLQSTTDYCIVSGNNIYASGTTGGGDGVIVYGDNNSVSDNILRSIRGEGINIKSGAADTLVTSNKLLSITSDMILDDGTHTKLGWNDMEGAYGVKAIQNSKGNTFPVTEDSIQDAIDDLAGNGTVYLPSGEITLTRTLYINHSHITLKGFGGRHWSQYGATILKQSSDIPNGIIRVMNTYSNYPPRGTIIEGIKFYNSDVTNYQANGIVMENATHSKILDCGFNNINGSAIYLRDSCYGVNIIGCGFQSCGVEDDGTIFFGTDITTPVVRDCIFEADAYSSIESTDTSSAFIVDNYFEGTSTKPRTDFIGGGMTGTIRGNLFTGGDATCDGIDISSQKLRIIGNTIEEVKLGIDVGQRCTISDNIISKTTDDAITALHNCTISGNNIQDVGDWGIVVQGDSTVIGNIVENATDDCLYTNGNRLTIIGNQFHGSSQYGISMPSDNCLVIANSLSRNTNGEFIDGGTGNIINGEGAIKNSNGKYYPATSDGIEDALNDTGEHGSVTFPYNTVITITRTIPLDDRNVVLDLNGCILVPSADGFDMINISKSGVTVMNGMIDVSGVTYTKSAILISGYNHDILNVGNRTKILDIVVNSTGNNGNGIHLYAGNWSHLASITNVLVSDVSTHNLDNGIFIQNENGDDSGGAGSALNRNIFDNIDGTNCKRFINISNRLEQGGIASGSSATNGNIFSNMQFQPAGNTEDVIWCEGDSNVFTNLVVWDWWSQRTTDSDPIMVNYTSDSTDTFVSGTYSLNDTCISDNGNGNSVFFWAGESGTTPIGNLQLTAVNISYYNPYYSGSGIKWYSETSGNPYTYFYGSVSGTPKYGGMRVIDTFGDWQFITEHSGSDITFQPNSDVVNIEDCIRLTPRADPPTAQEGRIYYDSDDGRLYMYNGSWVSLMND